MANVLDVRSNLNYVYSTKKRGKWSSEGVDEIKSVRTETQWPGYLYSDGALFQPFVGKQRFPES